MLDYEKVIDVIFGRWKSQILHAGVELGIFDLVSMQPKNAAEIATELGLDSELAYRLLRALASMGFLKENDHRAFSIASLGELVRSDHPQTLRGVTLLEEGPEHYAIWKHLVPMIKDGKQDGFSREFGVKIFDYASKNPAYGELFNKAMSSYSAMHTRWVLDALENYDFSAIKTICDIGGGQGHLLCSLILQHPHLSGTVLELGSVIKDKQLLWADRMGVQDRCLYLEGDMFREVPRADAYMMKMILHDWDDEECVKILSNIQKASPPGGRIFLVEHVVPGPQTPHFSKIFDIHMMCALTGRERTVDEYAKLLELSGLKYVETHHPRSGEIAVIEGVKQ